MDLKYLALVLVACNAVEAPDANTAAVTQALFATECADPRVFGAVVNDGVDDMAAIQSAIDSALATTRPVCLPVGTLHVTKRPGTGLSNVASLTVSGDGLTIYGQGDYSRISMLGGSAGDWWVFKITGSNHTLRQFSIDGSERTSSTEQTHLIQVWGPASDITLESMRLNLPPIGPSTGGDCIRAAGEEPVPIGSSNPPTPVTGLTIDRVRGIYCDRAFVSLQRWVFGVRLTNSSNVVADDSPFHEEPTGNGTIGDVVISNCRLRRNGNGNGTGLTIVGGAGNAEPGYDHTVERTTIDGGILVLNSGSVILRGVRAVSQGAAPTLEIKKDSAHVLVDGGYFEHFGSTPAPVVGVSFYTSASPRFVTVRKAHLVQRTGDHVIRGEPARNLAVEGNEIECLGPTADTFAAVFARATVAPVTGISVTSNTVTGNCKQLVRAAATASYGIGVVKARDNTAESVTTGVYFENGTPSAKPSVDSNSFGSLPQSSHVVGAGTNGYIGTN